MTLEKGRGKYSKYLPYAFTEHGVTMLANILKSKRAVRMSIAVVRAFISLKQLALQHKEFAARLDELRKELHERIGEFMMPLKTCSTKKQKRRTGTKAKESDIARADI